MKLNYRDKVILGVLLAIVILIAGFVGLVKPKNEEIKTDEATLATKQQEQADLEARIAKIEPLKKNINDTYEETGKLTADFIPLDDIDTPVKLDQYMQHYAEECGVRIESLEVSSPRESDLGYYYSEIEAMPASALLNSADLNGDYAEAQNKLLAESNALSERNVETLIQTQYGIRVTGTREALWKYMKAVEELKKSMLINQVSIDDYSFGANKAEEEGIDRPEPETTENPENLENPENPEGQPTEENPEAPVPAPAPEELTIDDAYTSSIQIVISLYSVYDMPKPNTEE